MPIINYNSMASNALRQLNINQSNQAKSMAKLSSGLRINTAADDAAGLAISEKMKGQIRGLDQASRNAQDGQSMINTAEGALGQTTDILQRMRELATQASNDTNTSQDRTNIQKEVDQLSTEITRISNTTEFNKQNLLNGSITTTGTGEDTLQIGANAGQTMKININAMDAASLGVARSTSTASLGTNNGGVSSADADSNVATHLATGAYTVKVTDTAAGSSTATAATGNTVSIGAGAVSGTANADTTVTLTYSSGAAGSDATIAAAQAGATNADTLAFDSGSKSTSYNGIKIALTGAGQNGAPTASWDSTNNQIVISLDNTTQTNNTAAKIQSAIQALGNVTKSDGTTSVDLSKITVAGAGAFNSGGAAIASADTFTSAAFAGGTNTVAAAWTASGNLSGPISGSTNAVNGLNIDITKLTGASNGDVVTVKGYQNGSATAQLFNSTGTTSIGNALTIDQTNGGTYMLGNTTTGQLNVTFGANGATAGNTTVNVTTTAATSATFSNGVKTADASAAGGIDVSSSADAASKAITVIDNAINKVSAERAKLGAYSNRLDNTVNNLNTSSQNISDAQSRIADVDMAKEMMNQSKSSVLAQAAQAMLAQANQQPQQVLQLLR